MCGIVGYLGPENGVTVVIEGLSRLEYRGYDSAGLVLKDSSGNYKYYKQVGKLENLKKEIASMGLNGQQVIGHTRWATHGKVTQANAHPHGNGEFAVVHNGIIENHLELRKQLKAEDWTFQSETDTEVFCGLLWKELKKKIPLEKAVGQVFSQVKGNSAFVVIHHQKNEMVAIKRAAPLVCGEGDLQRELFVSSDPYALVGQVTQVFFPEDNVLCHLKGEGGSGSSSLSFYELDLSPSQRFQSAKQAPALAAVEKGPYQHYMLKEIFEQPSLVEGLKEYYLGEEGSELLNKCVDLRPKKVHISACGTAWHAGLMIRHFVEKLAKIPVEVDLASEFRYRGPLLDIDQLGLFISQSGETADTLAAQDVCIKEGLKTLSIVNVEGSTLWRNSTMNLPIRGGVEIGVASTKAFTLQALVGYLLAGRWSGQNINTLAEKITLLGKRIKELLFRRHELQRIAREIYNMKGFLFTGRGPLHTIALEGALKLKEIAYVHAEGYASGELKHGPLALVDEKMVNVALLGSDLFDKSFSNLEEVKARGGIIVSIGPVEKSQELTASSRHFFPLDYSGLDHLAPLYANVCTQVLAYEVARLKGTDIDKPRNLAKSVTVE